MKTDDDGNAVLGVLIALLLEVSLLAVLIVIGTLWLAAFGN